MFNALLKLLTAALIAFGIVTYVTGGDYAQVSVAAGNAYDQAMSRKRERVEAADSAEAETQGAQSTADTAVQVVTMASSAKPLERTLKMTGSTKASRSVDLRAETGGVLELAPERGQRVSTGDLLCRLAIGNRNARRAATIARLNQAITEARAQNSLSEKGFAAANAASKSRSEAEVLRAEIQQIDIEIANLEIRAPFDGVVEVAPAELGSLLQVGNTCATIVDPDPLRISGYAPEFDVGRLSLGALASAKLATGQTVQGRVAFIAQTADQSTRTFEVEVEVPNPSYALRDAVTAAIEIPVDTQRAHLLPQSALTLDADGNIGVMLSEGGTARFQAVEMLRDGGDGAWVSGLGERASVIVVGQEYVSDGSRIDATQRTGNILGEGT